MESTGEIKDGFLTYQGFDIWDQAVAMKITLENMPDILHLFPSSVVVNPTGFNPFVSIPREFLGLKVRVSAEVGDYVQATSDGYIVVEETDFESRYTR